MVQIARGNHLRIGAQNCNVPLEHKRLVLCDMNRYTKRANHGIKNVIFLGTALFIQLVIILLRNKLRIREIDKYYKTADNSLQLTSNKIVPAATAERSGKLSSGKTQYKNAANAFDVHFSGSGTPEVSVAYQGASVTFSPVVPLGTSSRQSTGFAVGKVTTCKALDALTYTGDNTVTYSNAFPDTDLVYVLENNILKEYIILNNTNASNSFQFTFALEGVALESMGRYAEFVDQNGAVLFALDSLFAVDANGAFTDNLKYTFAPVKDTNTVTVTVTLDRTFFENAVFPVIIDPTIMISSTETADACVCSYTPDTNYWLDVKLRTGMDDGYGVRRTFIKFNIPDTIPEGSVTFARLDMEMTSGETPMVKAYQCTSDWSSSTITWDNMPDGEGNFALESTLCTRYSATSSWYVMTVTEIVRDWIDGLSSNYGFILKDEEEGLTDHWTTWYSSDAPSPHKPELHITYEGVDPEDPDPDDENHEFDPEPDPDDPDPHPDPDPEPEPTPVPLHSIRLYGVATSGHDHESSLQYVSSLLDSYGLTDNIVRTGAFFPHNFKEELKAARIVTTRSHGIIVLDDDHSVLATGLKLNDGTVNNRWYILDNNNPTSGAAYTYISDTDIFTTIDLALFVGCKTAANGVDQSNFAKRIFEQGARVSLGFKETIDCEPSNNWTEMFYECFLRGNSVERAVEYASIRVTSFSGLRDIAIFGDATYTIN